MCILFIVGMFYSGVVWCVLLFFVAVFAAASVVVHLKNLIDCGEVLFRSCLCVYVRACMFFRSCCVCVCRVPPIAWVRTGVFAHSLGGCSVQRATLESCGVKVIHHGFKRASQRLLPCLKNVIKKKKKKVSLCKACCPVRLSLSRASLSLSSGGGGSLNHTGKLNVWAGFCLSFLLLWAGGHLTVAG